MRNIFNKGKTFKINVLPLVLLVFFCFTTQYIYGENITVTPSSIQFNYEGGNTYDALAISNSSGQTITGAEWTNTSSQNFAYVMGQSNRRIKVAFNSNYSGNMNVIIKLTEYSGNAIGTICNIFIPNFNGSEQFLNLSDTVPGYIGKFTYTWKWEIYAMPTASSSYCAASTTTYTTHTYYTLLATPKTPMTIPPTDILNYACDWAYGATDEGSICSDILNYGFNLHYTWNYDCHYLSSDFVRLVSSLGVTASLHRWTAPGVYLGDMIGQITRQIDPVGSEPLNVYKFWFHQWAQAASAQRDPSTNTTFTGTWGNYEDYLFTKYDYISKVSPETITQVQNQPGQPIGSCEDYVSTVKHAEYANDYIIKTWRGPDR